MTATSAGGGATHEMTNGVDEANEAGPKQTSDGFAVEAAQFPSLGGAAPSKPRVASSWTRGAGMKGKPGPDAKVSAAKAQTDGKKQKGTKQVGEGIVQPEPSPEAGPAATAPSEAAATVDTTVGPTAETALTTAALAGAAETASVMIAQAPPIETETVVADAAVGGVPELQAAAESRRVEAELPRLVEPVPEAAPTPTLVLSEDLFPNLSARTDSRSAARVAGNNTRTKRQPAPAPQSKTQGKWAKPLSMSGARDNSGGVDGAAPCASSDAKVAGEIVPPVCAVGVVDELAKTDTACSSCTDAEVEEDHRSPRWPEATDVVATPPVMFLEVSPNLECEETQPVACQPGSPSLTAHVSTDMDQVAAAVDDTVQAEKQQQQATKGRGKKKGGQGAGAKASAAKAVSEKETKEKERAAAAASAAAEKSKKRAEEEAAHKAKLQEVEDARRAEAARALAEAPALSAAAPRKPMGAWGRPKAVPEAAKGQTTPTREDVEAKQEAEAAEAEAKWNAEAAAAAAAEEATAAAAAAAAVAAEEAKRLADEADEKVRQREEAKRRKEEAQEKKTAEKAKKRAADEAARREAVEARRSEEKTKAAEKAAARQAEEARRVEEIAEKVRREAAEKAKQREEKEDGRRTEAARALAEGPALTSASAPRKPMGAWGRGKPAVKADVSSAEGPQASSAEATIQPQLSQEQQTEKGTEQQQQQQQQQQQHQQQLLEPRPREDADTEANDGKREAELLSDEGHVVTEHTEGAQPVAQPEVPRIHEEEEEPCDMDDPFAMLGGMGEEQVYQVTAFEEAVEADPVQTDVVPVDEAPAAASVAKAEASVGGTQKVAAARSKATAGVTRSKAAAAPPSSAIPSAVVSDKVVDSKCQQESAPAQGARRLLGAWSKGPLKLLSGAAAAISGAADTDTPTKTSAPQATEMPKRVVRVDSSQSQENSQEEAVESPSVSVPEGTAAGAVASRRVDEAACLDVDRALEDMETADSSGPCLKGDAESRTHTDEDPTDEVGSSFESVPSAQGRASREDSDGEAVASAATGNSRAPSSAVGKPSCGKVSLNVPGALGQAKKDSKDDDSNVLSKAFPAAELLRWRQALEEHDACLEVHCVASTVEEGYGRSTSSSRPSDRYGDRGGQRRADTFGRQSKGGNRGGFFRREYQYEPVEVKPVETLETSSSSWSAQQKAFRENRSTDVNVDEDDVTITRKIRSILNKLTVERFAPLLQQLLESGISKQEHLEILMHEIMEKATTQHHFIAMYTELCKQLHEWCVANKIGDFNGKGGFKRILLNECQRSFERYLKQPEHLKTLTGDDLLEAEVKYKTAMLGNIRFVGALLSMKMVASQVFFGITSELLSDPFSRPEVLECLAAFLTTVGGQFEANSVAVTKNSAAYTDVFKQLERLSKEARVPARIRCLLGDVLDLRQAGWEDQKLATKGNEAPTTIDAVHSRAWDESRVAKGGWDKQNYGGFQQAASRSSKAPWANTGGGRRGWNYDQVAVDPSTVRDQLKKTVKELALSHELDEAVSRAKDLNVPVKQQAAELTHVLTQIAEETNHESRALCFKFVLRLFIDRIFDSSELPTGLDKLAKDCQELQLDIVGLPHILRNECLPTLRSLVTANMLSSEHLEAFSKRIS
eukprot:TRINITY_DN11880_c0_g2_i1.p1 TRINITY_DN11880_c0_g2~~TRINITY_DN11880_c0_g2_i1.p1  ORF type:complete len:1644 (-),score=449.51 TRINITY_DN11880_c0_g2_i1:73-4968(-)